MYKNIENLTVAPDTHVVRSTHRLGLITDEELSRSDVQLIVIDRWNELFKGTKYKPIDIHTPLWLWSRWFKGGKIMKILIGTKNPGKIEGATEAFKNYFDDFDIEGIPVSSDVSEEPVNNEIYEGARNRVDNLMKYAKEFGINAEYFLGVESGITNLLGKWVIINIAVVKDKNGYESWGTSPAFPVPNKYVDEIISTDLGKVMDKIFEQNDLRSGKGGISFITNGVISRIDLTREAFIMALTQHTNQVWNDKKVLKK